MAEQKQEAIKGGPGEAAEGDQKQQGSQQEQKTQVGAGRVKVQVGDREIEVDESIALILDAQQRGFEDHQQKTAQYVRQLEQRIAPRAESGEGVAGRQESKTTAPDFYDDPNGWMTHHMGQLQKNVQGYVDGALSKTEKKTREREFWDEFYGDNEDLKGAERLVSSVFNENLDRLADMPVGKAKSEIARLARSERDKLVRPYLNPGGEQKPPGDQQSLRQIVTRPGGGGERKGGSAEDERPQTLSGVLKARRQQRFQRRASSQE